MYFLFSGEGATDLGACAAGAAVCEGQDYQHGPMTVIVDQIVRARRDYSPLGAGCCGFVPRRKPQSSRPTAAAYSGLVRSKVDCTVPFG